MLYFQLVIMAGTVMLAYYFEYTDTFTVHVQGFFCYDTTYTKPYLGPEDRSAVPPVLLYAVVAGLPTLLVSQTSPELRTENCSIHTLASGVIYCCYINYVLYNNRSKPLPLNVGLIDLNFLFYHRLPSMYVTCTVQAKGTRLAKPVLSLGFMCLAFLTGLNRVAEYRNHWSDVIAGFVIGTAIATFLVVCVVHNFKGKLLLNDESPAEQRSNTAMLNMARVESPLEKYIASQVADTHTHTHTHTHSTHTHALSLALSHTHSF
uniref:Phospholipid phosphatase related 5b n=1 Tax=Salarias fasciatus TaxID=181472 RepID=A0A672FP17_SALFA